MCVCTSALFAHMKDQLKVTHRLLQIHITLPNQYNLKEKGRKCPRLHNLHSNSVLIRLATQFFPFLRLEYARTGFNFA